MKQIYLIYYQGSHQIQYRRRLFLDFGNVWGVDYDGSIDESNKLRSSTGIAASWRSPLGPMTFVFSTNLSKASTDKTESFNFNLGTTF